MTVSWKSRPLQYVRKLKILMIQKDFLLIQLPVRARPEKWGHTALTLGLAPMRRPKTGAQDEARL
jgi:hypothetical protein